MRDSVCIELLRKSTDNVGGSVVLTNHSVTLKKESIRKTEPVSFAYLGKTQ